MSEGLRSAASRERAGGVLARAARQLSRISVRLLAFNVLVVFLPAAGVLFLDTYETHLLRAQERTMGQEGRLLAAALQAHGDLDPAYARAVLVQLGQRHLARLRVLDRGGTVIADSAALGPRRETEATEDGVEAPVDTTSPTGIQAHPLYRLASLPFRLLRRSSGVSATEPLATDDPSSWPEVRDALQGRYGASTRIRDSESPVVLLFIAIPVRIDGGVEGVVLVSQSTTRILTALYAVRFDVLKVFLASLGAAVVLSLLFATTIARPLGRLRRRAEAILDRRGRLRGGFEPSRRADEIGDLERALAELTRRLEEHLRFADGFAADVAHEFKNPLASIRTACDLAQDAEDEADRRRFLTMAQDNVARMERLLSDAREVSRIDAELEAEDRQDIVLDELLTALVDGFRLRHGDRGPQLVLALADQQLVVLASADRLVQAFENLIDNAVSFSPPGGAITVTLARTDGEAVVTVADEGPGIPPEHRERVFDRFFSYRPGAQARGTHSGLGLAIVRAVIEAYGGTVTAQDRSGGGAKMVARLPISRVR